jgi:hypothetical protein
MFPLLPAILLLLLHGPTGAERLGLRGRVAEPLEAISRSMHEGGSLRDADRVVLAKLLSAAQSAGLSDAILAFLQDRRLVHSQGRPALDVPASIRPAVVRTNEGFARSIRARDGPSPIAA